MVRTCHKHVDVDVDVDVGVEGVSKEVWREQRKSMSPR